MKIKEARLMAGLTQQGLSDLLDIPRRTIQAWEGGQRHCPKWCERLIVDKINQLMPALKRKK